MALFTGNEGKSALRPNGKLLTCSSCGLHRSAKRPRMKAFGGFEKGILNIGGAPSSLDDDRGRPFQGPAGRLLKEVYAKFGIDPIKDCLNINAVNCYPGDAPVTAHHGMCCYNMVRKVIDENKPKVVMLLGQPAVVALLGTQWDQMGNIGQWRGFQIPDRLHETWMCPVFHPDHIKDTEKFPEVRTVWEGDFASALQCLDRPRPTKADDTQQVQILEDAKVGAVLERLLINPPKMLAFDYETTGLKPHAKGHQIVSCAICPDAMKAFSFFMPKDKEAKKMLIRILQHPEIGKVAANMQFEQAWSLVRLNGTVPTPWIWDTMQAAHVLDNRPLITSLKFQSFVKMGVPDYAKEVGPYLRGRDEKNANSMNRILELVDSCPDKLLMYGGLDALYEYRLALIQMKELGFPIPQLAGHWTNHETPWANPYGIS